MDESALWDEIGKIHLKIASFDDAVAAFSKAIELNASQARYYGDLAAAYCLKGKNIEAIALYHKCLELPSSDSEKIAAWNRLADIYGRMDDYRSAAAAYARAAELSRVASDPGNGRGLQRNHDTTIRRERSDEPGSEGTPSAHRPAQPQTERTDPTGSFLPDSKSIAPARSASEPGESDGGLAKRLAAVEAVIAARMAARAVSASAEKPAAPVSDPTKSGQTEPPRQALVSTTTSALSARTRETPGDGRLAERAAGAQPPQAELRTWGLVPTPSSVQLWEGGEGETQGFNSGVSALPGHVLANEAETSGVAIAEPATLESSDAEMPPVAAEPSPRSYLDDPVEVQRLLNQLATYRRITDIAPANDRAWDRIGRISKDLGRDEDAIRAFHRAIEIAPGQADYHYHLGLVYAAEKRYEDAIAAFLRTVELVPDHILAHCAVAGCYVRLGRGEEAEKHLEIARPEMISEKEYNRACFEAICGNVDLAIELLRVALESKQTTMTWVRCDPDLDFIRTDPRFQALVAVREPAVVVAESCVG